MFAKHHFDYASHGPGWRTIAHANSDGEDELLTRAETMVREGHRVEVVRGDAHFPWATEAVYALRQYTREWAELDQIDMHPGDRKFL